MSSTPLCNLPPGPKNQRVSLPGGCNLAAWGGPGETPKWREFGSCFRSGFGLDLGSPRGPQKGPKWGSRGAQDGFGAGLPPEAVFGPILGPFWEPPEPSKSCSRRGAVLFFTKIADRAWGGKIKPQMAQTSSPKCPPAAPRRPQRQLRMNNKF